MIDKESGVDLSRCDRDQLARVLREARNSIFQAAISVCEDLETKGLNARHCASALRVMRARVNGEVALAEKMIEDVAQSEH